jgi:hypothetical protein
VLEGAGEPSEVARDDRPRGARQVGDAQVVQRLAHLAREIPGQLGVHQRELLSGRRPIRLGRVGRSATSSAAKLCFDVEVI